MGCGASSQKEEQPTPTNKRKQEQDFQSLNGPSPVEDSQDYSPTPETDLQRELSRNGTEKNSPGRSPKSTPRKAKPPSMRSREKSHENGEVADSEAHEKGYKRMVRQKMIDATSGHDLQELHKTIENFEKQKLDDCGDLRRAKEKLQYLTLKRDLRDAIRRRHAGVLEKSIQDAKNSKFADKLTNQIQVAEKLQRHLQELKNCAHDICKMEQTTISELRSYHHPPPCVHDVMAATYMLMGYSEDRLGDWNEIQAYLGQLTRDKLIRQIGEFDTKHVNEITASRVKSILQAYTLEEVKDASYGAATFYVWADNMVAKIEKDKESEYDREQTEVGGSATSKGGGSVKKKG
ncbi:hypothetical protein LOTGIDRAFT_228104 [Lottia gigantea]|uniref:Uncharacterized protein n=1 Tax=Lottia gigantea TaxID=225164 RepID=V4AN37_LOTGI|nr:hypothetical protein LOTGIDRAFT_228104 [Lottia gigantea]ESP05579.1 hypothetical protein LOTGIDRAFT_228104 [Lottia gigantea]